MTKVLHYLKPTLKWGVFIVYMGFLLGCIGFLFYMAYEIALAFLHTTFSLRMDELMGRIIGLVLLVCCIGGALLLSRACFATVQLFWERIKEE